MQSALMPSTKTVESAKVLGCYSPRWALCGLRDVSTPGNRTCL